jgi:hypothetical protein
MVPSQTSDGTTYTVDLKGAAPKCSCPDHEVRQMKCKDIYAAEFSVRRETRPDGTTTVTKTLRVTYGQNWTAYNAAQTHEKERVSELRIGHRTDFLGRNAACPTKEPESVIYGQSRGTPLPPVLLGVGQRHRRQGRRRYFLSLCFLAQFSFTTCRARPSASASGGTGSVTTEPAPT